MESTRRTFLQFSAVTLATGVMSARASDYPTRPVTIVVPTAPAGTTDITARFLAEYISKSLGKQFIVENAGGGSGNIGNSRAARSAPDGYTLLLSYSGYHVTNPHLFKSPGWDPLTSFDSIGLAVKAPHVMLLNSRLPVKTLAEFLAYAKANKGKLTYASSGNGSIQHIGGERLKQVAGLDMVHVPYRGAGQVMNDLIAGNVDLFITTPPSAIGHIKSGTVTALALAADKRHPLLPDVPTTVEAGLSGYELVAWFGMFAPKGLEPEVRKRLVSAIEAAVKNPEFEAKIEQHGAYTSYLAPADLDVFVRQELEYWGKVIKAAGIATQS